MPDDRIDEMEERLLILRDKVAREGFEVPDEVLEYIARKYAMPQTLKGALINVQAYASRRNIPVDMDVARLVLEGIRPGAWVEPSTGPMGGQEADTLFPVDASKTTAPVAPIGEAGSEPAGAPLGGAASSTPERGGAPAGQEAGEPAGPRTRPPAEVWFAPVRTTRKESLVARARKVLERAGLSDVVADGDLVAIKLHFGEEGNTGFVHPVFVREVVRAVRAAGGKPFLTDANTLYRGKRANAADHIACAIGNGFSFATVEAPIIIADGLDGRDAVEVPILGGKHFESVRIGSAAVHADALVVITHVKGHEATGMGGALKNVGMGLGCRSAKQRMHSDLRPEVTGEKCTACGRCVTWCPVGAIAIGPDRVAVIDQELCYGCGECVAACPSGAIAIQWKTEPDAIQEKIVEHAAGVLSGKEGKAIHLSFLTDITPDCDCWHFSDASVVPDIGVLASQDIVAIDQAACDLIAAVEGLPGTRGEGLEAGQEKFAAVTGVDPTWALRYAESLGLGSRTYHLRELG